MLTVGGTRPQNAKGPDVAVEAQFSHRAFCRSRLATPAGIERVHSANIDVASETYELSERPTSPDRSRSTPDAEAIGPTNGPMGPVEAALARALDAAAVAGRFDVVAQLAEELRARRLAAAGNVLELAADRRRRR